MKRSQQALAVGAAAGALAFLAAKRRGISLKKWLRVQAEIAHIVVRNSTKDGNWRWSRLRELLFLASLERSRRLEVAEADVVAPNDPITPSQVRRCALTMPVFSDFFSTDFASRRVEV